MLVCDRTDPPKNCKAKAENGDDGFDEIMFLVRFHYYIVIVGVVKMVDWIEDLKHCVYVLLFFILERYHR